MPVSSKDLLDQLTDLQLALEDYSFEKMTADQARVVKHSYDNFRAQLESLLWNSGARAKNPGPATPKDDTGHREGALEAIGHDLRNPLHGLIGFAGILAEAPVSEPYKSIAGSLEMVARTMAESVEELCAISKVKGDSGTSVQVPFSPKELLEETSEYARLRLLEKPVDIELSWDTAVPGTLMGNPSDLRRILLHLIDNACRFTVSGQIRMVAGLSKDPAHPVLSLSISDTGIGITSAELPHVFTPYYQGKQAMDLAAGGFGFGLSIVRSLVAKQGGTIQIRSRAGSGTTVALTLPFTSGALDAREQRKKDTPEARAGSLRGMRVLVLENLPVNLHLLRSRLGDLGCDVLVVENIAQAILVLESEPMDVFLMDFRPRSKKDIEALGAIRGHENPYIREFPIVGMSADRREAIATSTDRQGIDGWLFKPFTLATLCDVLGKYRGETPQGAPGPGISNPAGHPEAPLLDLSTLEARTQGDTRSMNSLLQALRNGLLEFAGRTRLALEGRDYQSIAIDSKKLLSVLELIGAHSLIPSVIQIRNASCEGTDENRLIRAYSEYLARFPAVADALQDNIGRPE
jgi:CheY-like chemotaxis protein